MLDFCIILYFRNIYYKGALCYTMNRLCKLSIMMSLVACIFVLSGIFSSAQAEFAPYKPKGKEVQHNMNRTAVFNTNRGEFKIELFEDKAPLTTGNFIKLAEEHFYDGVIFHRVIDGFMIQGGDPTGTGTGGPGYTIPDEFDPALRHDAPGILSMANAGPNTGGSQFFITLDKTPWLDGHHAVFGKVISGMDVVEAIGHVQTDMRDRPLHDVVIESVTIE